MSYELSYHREEEFLRVDVTGVRTREATIAMAWEILKACGEQAASKVLVDLRQLEGELDRVDAYEIASIEFPKLQSAGVVTKMAIIDLEQARSRLRFFETVAVNRGVNMRVFSDLGEATAWLIQK